MIYTVDDDLMKGNFLFQITCEGRPCFFIEDFKSEQEDSKVTCIEEYELSLYCQAGHKLHVFDKPNYEYNSIDSRLLPDLAVWKVGVLEGKRNHWFVLMFNSENGESIIMVFDNKRAKLYRVNFLSFLDLILMYGGNDIESTLRVVLEPIMKQDFTEKKWVETERLRDTRHLGKQMHQLFKSSKLDNLKDEALLFSDEETLNLYDRNIGYLEGALPVSIRVNGTTVALLGDYVDTFECNFIPDSIMNLSLEKDVTHTAAMRPGRSIWVYGLEEKLKQITSHHSLQSKWNALNWHNLYNGDQASCKHYFTDIDTVINLIKGTDMLNTLKLDSVNIERVSNFLYVNTLRYMFVINYATEKGKLGKLIKALRPRELELLLGVASSYAFLFYNKEDGKELETYDLLCGDVPFVMLKLINFEFWESQVSVYGVRLDLMKGDLSPVHKGHGTLKDKRTVGRYTSDLIGAMFGVLEEGSNRK